MGQVTNPTRYVIIHTEQGNEKASMKDLHAGDIFTMYEPDNEQVGNFWKAISEPAINSSGIWGINAEEVGVK